MTPAARPSTALSVRSWATRRRRLAPSASRRITSPRRTRARASSRFATFTHAMSRTIVTAPASTSTLTRTSRVRNSSSPHTRTLRACGPGGKRASRLRDNRSISACARSRVTPGRSRANTRAVRGRPSRAPSSAIGTMTSAEAECRSASGDVKSSRRMPTITRDAPSSVMRSPRAERAPPNRRCHNPWLIIATGFPPGRSSSGRNVRPAAVDVPSIGSSSAFARTSRTISGSPRPDRLAVPGATATSDSNDCASARHTATSG